jgi:hypothetical protein
MLAGLDQAEQAQVQASETYRQQRIGALEAETDARLAVVERGGQEEANIRQDFANKLKQLQADSSQAQLDLLKAQTEKVAAIVSGSLSSIGALQDADSQAKLARIDAEMNKETTSAARKAILEKQKLRLEQQAAEQRKRLARAEAVVQLGQAVMLILSQKSLLPSPLAEITKGLEIAAATATAYAQFRAIDSAKFAQGGVLRGPSHAQGGIPLFHRRTGRPLGAEAEGDEIILTKGVYQNPTLRAMASALNVAGGGRALMANALALPPNLKESFASALAIPARYAQGGVVSSSVAFLPAIRTGGVVPAPAPVIDYDQLGKALASHLTTSLQSMVSTLPVPSLSLTELRERQQNIEKRQSLTDI